MEAKQILQSRIAAGAVGAALVALIWLAIGLNIEPVRASGNVDPPLGRVAACPVAALDGAVEGAVAMPRYCVCAGALYGSALDNVLAAEP